MSLSTDVLYIERIRYMLEGFDRKSDDKWVFRCPYCGDSASDKHKRRGAFIVVDGSVGFKCKNCGVGRYFHNFLQDWDQGLYEEYQLENYQDSNSWDKFAKKQIEDKKPEELVVPATTSLEDILKSASASSPSPDDWMKAFVPATPLAEMAKVSTLPANHPGRVYLAGRGWKPGVRGFDELLWTDNFKMWAHIHAGKEEPKQGWSDPRVVAPLITPEGIEVGAQGRAIKPESKLKYVTAMMNKRAVACFGGHFADFKQEIWVTEGVYDSLAFENGLAGLHSDLAGFARSYGLRRESTVLVFDNEPGNWQVKQKVLEAVKDDWRVAFWREPQMVVGKDAAAAIVERGLSSQELFNIVSGLGAELEFARWSGGLA